MSIPRNDGARVHVRVQPRAGRDLILGWRGDVLRVSVSAPPVDGEANRAVVALLARALGVPASALSIVRGERGRDKLLQVAGLTDVTILRGLGGPPTPLTRVTPRRSRGARSIEMGGPERAPQAPHALVAPRPSRGAPRFRG